MIVPSVWRKSFDFFRKPVVVEPTDAQLSSDAGLLPIRQFDEVIGLIEQFIASFDAPPGQLTLDVDPFDDPTHGEQQLTFFHGYYQQQQYLPRAITCAENDRVAMICLLHGTAHPALGADDDVSYLVEGIDLWANSNFAAFGRFTTWGKGGATRTTSRPEPSAAPEPKNAATRKLDE